MNWTGGPLQRHVKRRSHVPRYAHKAPFTKFASQRSSISKERAIDDAAVQPLSEQTIDDARIAGNPSGRPFATQSCDGDDQLLKRSKGKRPHQYRDEMNRDVAEPMAVKRNKAIWNTTGSRPLITNAGNSLLKKSDWVGLNLRQSVQPYAGATTHRVGMARQRRQRQHSRANDEVSATLYKRRISMDESFPNSQSRRLHYKRNSQLPQSKFVLFSPPTRYQQPLNRDSPGEQSENSRPWYDEHTETRSPTAEVLDSLVPLDVARKLDSFDHVKAVHLANVENRRSLKIRSSLPHEQSLGPKLGFCSSAPFGSSASTSTSISPFKESASPKQYLANIPLGIDFQFMVADSPLGDVPQQARDMFRLRKPTHSSETLTHWPGSIGEKALSTSSTCSLELLMNTVVIQPTTTAQEAGQGYDGYLRWLPNSSPRRQGSESQSNLFASPPCMRGLSRPSLDNSGCSPRRLSANPMLSDALVLDDTDKLLQNDWPEVYLEANNAFMSNFSDGFRHVQNKYSMSDPVKPPKSTNLAASASPGTVSVRTPSGPSIRDKCFGISDPTALDREFKLAPGPTAHVEWYT